MIFGRPVALWNGLVVAIAAAIIATANAAGVAINLEMVAADIAVASVVLGILANKATNGSLLGRARVSKRS
jgi:hypothetical protein